MDDAGATMVAPFFIPYCRYWQYGFVVARAHAHAAEPRRFAPCAPPRGRGRTSASGFHAPALRYIPSSASALYAPRADKGGYCRPLTRLPRDRDRRKRPCRYGFPPLNSPLPSAYPFHNED